MALTKAQKASILEKLNESLKGAQSVVFVHFKGLPIAEESAMRKALRARSVGYTVAKKTLLRRALGELAPRGDMPELSGEISVAYGADSVTPASSVAEFAKAYDNKISIVGGIFEGRYMTQAEMREIASIPPMQTLRGMLVNIINSPIAGLAVALHAVAEKKSA